MAGLKSKMRSFRLRTRVLAAVGFPIAAFAAFFAIYFPSVLEEAAHDALWERASTLARVGSNLVAPRVDAKNSADIRVALQTLKEDSDIRYVTVLDRQNNVIETMTKDENLVEKELRRGVESFAMDVSDNLLHVRVPLWITRNAVEQVQIGSLVMGFSVERIGQTRQSASDTALMVTLIIFLFGSLLAWMFSGNIARPLLGTSGRLNTVAQDLVDAAKAREIAASREAEAVEQTRRTMDVLLTSAEQISESAADVLINAERTQAGNMEIAKRIDDLNHHAEKVAEILASIMQVADRADLLALNAAVEGTKAGKAGRGFLMVANEMRRLAENVTASVESIQRVLQEVRLASMDAVTASLGGTESSAQTTQSVRDIAGVTEQQRLATIEVSRNMEDMTELLNQAMIDIKYTTKSARALSGVADGLSRLINPLSTSARRTDRETGE
jgi:methyl-accepting chemotaxis protein